ncbi:MAG: glutamate--tRNA ligase family protein [Puniceicoccaceae bacterium]
MSKDYQPSSKPYRGRIAPTPSGWLHLGHAATFRMAWERARQAKGTIIYRTEDLDPARYRDEYDSGAIEDLHWWGLDWDEGPDCGGPFEPYQQSRKLEVFKAALDKLKSMGLVYPSAHSRKEIEAANPAKSPVNGDIIFPPDLRLRDPSDAIQDEVNWRFRVPDGRWIDFNDNRLGPKSFKAGTDFGDFIVWKKDDWPAYELGVVVDDHDMQITEVVRGEDLLMSTAKQLLLYEALGWQPPQWYHCPLVIDPETGTRMSKTHKSMGLRALREAGHAPGLQLEAYFETQED